VGKPEGMGPLEMSIHKYVDNTKMDLEEMKWDGVDWNDVAHCRDLRGPLRAQPHGVSGLRHYSKSRKVTGSVSEKVIGFFSRLNPSSASMNLGWIQPLTEESNRRLTGRKRWPASPRRNSDFCESVFYKTWERQHPTSLWASAACCRDSFTLRTKDVYAYVYSAS
jgi:hypothetical protein